MLASAKFQWDTHSQTECHELKQWRLAIGDKPVDLLAKALCQARKQIQGNDDESAIWLVDILWVVIEGLILLKRGADDSYAALEHWSGVRRESGTGRDRHRR